MEDHHHPNAPPGQVVVPSSSPLKSDNNLPRLIIFASGTKTGGGSGFEALVNAQRNGILRAEIVAVVSNWPEGGVKERATRLGVPFDYFEKPFSGDRYVFFLRKYNARWVSLCGWLKLVPVVAVPVDEDVVNNNNNEEEKGEEGGEGNGQKNKMMMLGLPSSRTVNIHPGPLPKFGGAGMYGINVQKAVLEAFQKGEVKETGPSIHFVTANYDEGPIIATRTFAIDPEDTPETLRQKTQTLEHKLLPVILDLVVRKEIFWDGVESSSLRYIGDAALKERSMATMS